MKNMTSAEKEKKVLDVFLSDNTPYSILEIQWELRNSGLLHYSIDQALGELVRKKQIRKMRVSGMYKKCTKTTITKETEHKS